MGNYLESVLRRSISNPRNLKTKLCDLVLATYVHYAETHEVSTLVAENGTGCPEGVTPLGW